MVRATIILEIIEKNHLIENAQIVGDYFLEGLKSLELSNSRGRGLMLAFDCKDTESRNLLWKKLREKVLCLKCGQKSIRFRPPLTFSKEEADIAISYLKETL